MLRQVLVAPVTLAFATSAIAATPSGHAVPFATLPGYARDDHAAAFRVFRASCAALVGGVAPTRAALPPPAGLKTVCAEALALGPVIGEAPAKQFLETHFTPRLVATDAFFTGYYEPVVEGSLTRTATFPTPLYAMPIGRTAPMPDRAAIEAGALGEHPLLYLRDAVEAFFVQVQGSARIKLTDGSLRRLVYAGRNGYPYTSIGKLLVQKLNIPPAEMGMRQLKAWIRANGQGPDEAGTRLMQANRSYIFFRFDDSLPADAGPVGGDGVSLTALRSLAIDRVAWPYGLPYYINATLPWQGETPTPFRRLMIGQDTGSAIVGPARGDIFLGTGDAAAAGAGAIRDHGTLFVLWPKSADDLKTGDEDAPR